MTVSINSRMLDDNLRLSGYRSRDLRAGSVRYLAGGGAVDQSLPVDGGQEVTLSADLEGNSTYGAFSKADLDFLNGLRASGVTVPIEHHGVSFLARVMAVQLEPLMGEVDPNDDSVFVGPVTLLIK